MKPTTNRSPPSTLSFFINNPCHFISFILPRLIVQPVKYSIHQTALSHLIGRKYSYDEGYQTLIRQACSYILFY